MTRIVSNVIYILVYFNIFCYFTSGHKSAITFENGYYNGIVIGIDGDNVNSSFCAEIIAQLQLTFAEFSSKLHAATSSSAVIGRVDILIPQNSTIWSANICGLRNGDILNAPPTYSYKTSDIQVTTNHPLAETLPWTKQYKPCGHGGDSIILPLQFLHPDPIPADNFTQSVKGQLLLHEWTKLRYGAFEEIGYFGDEYYSACYTQNGQAELTTCTSSRLPSIAANISSCSWEVVMGQKDILQQQLNSSRSSIMASPYLENVYEFCNSTTHNPRGRTKHNAFCGRKSVLDVVNSHPDFSGAQQIDWKDPEFRIIRHERPWTPAYAFVIENSTDIGDQYKIVPVKQALSQFLAILDVEHAGIEILIETFSETELTLVQKYVDSDESKKAVLDNIIDVGNTDTGRIRQLATAIDLVKQNISAHSNLFWNIVLITSAPNIIDMSEAIQMLRNSDHSISVLTFDTTSDWLRWYEIPNTRAVITLPSCQSPQLQRHCALQTSEFIVDHLVGLVNDQQYFPRSVQKVASVQVATGAQPHSFQLNAEDASAVKRFYLFLSVTTTTTSIIVARPSGGGGCSPQPLFDYGYVITFDDTCKFENGNWSIQYSAQISGARAQLQAFLEYDDTVEEALIVTPSVGIVDLSEGIYPTNITFAYVEVSSAKGSPVVGADVKLQVYHTSGFSDTQVSKKEIPMHDNGNGADQTGNDGVYSAYLSGYSTQPAHHLIQVQVSTTANTRIMKSIVTPNATVLDDKMSGKCCGEIAPLVTNPSRLFKFQYLLHGFKTLEPFHESRYPPDVIRAIASTTESEESITIQFKSVAGDFSNASIVILEIQACCVPSNGGESPSPVPGDFDCRSGSVSCGEFLLPGQDQTCSMNKNKLVDLFLTGGQTVNNLICGVRLVNTNFVAGALSHDVFDVNVTVAAGAAARTDPECKSFSDDCLPMYIFWIMIGCLALLLLLLIIVGCCWYCKSSKRSKPTPTRRDEPRTIAQSEILSVQYEKQPRAPPSPMPKEEPKVFQELFVNHAYIQDGNGELKIIAGNGEIMTQSNHNEIGNNIANRGGNLTSPTPNRFPVQQQVPATLPVTTTYADTMQLFKSKLPPPQFRSPRPPQAQARSHQRQRPVIVHQNPQLRTNSSANSRFEVESSSPPPPTPPPPQLKYPSPSRGEPALVYASVARSRRPRPAINTGGQNHMLTFPRNKVAAAAAYPDYATPKNAGPGSRVVKHREPLPYMEPPPIDTFPTSTDSDSSLNAAPVGMRNQTFHDRPRYVNPPPYPIGSQLQNQPINTFIEKPVAQVQRPPVPPPRTQLSQRSTGPTGRSAVQTFSNKPEMGEFDDEENSDEWDDGDFELNANTGVSYA